MSDNDLIRRGDAVDAAWEASSLELFTLGPGKIVARINAIPAVHPTVSPDVAALAEAREKALREAEKVVEDMAAGALTARAQEHAIQCQEAILALIEKPDAR